MSSKEKGQFGKEHVICSDAVHGDCRRMIGGRELYRYQVNWAGRYVDWSFANQMYGPRWPEFFELPKLMIRDITGTHRVEATFDKTGLYCDHTILCAQRACDLNQWKPVSKATFEKSLEYNTAFLAGIVASKLVSYYFYLVLTGEGVRTGGGFHTYPETIRNFLIPKLEPATRATHDRLVQLVEAMLKTKAQISTAKSDSDRTYLEDKCAGLDRQIDQLVYELYDLTEEEIALVEGA